MVTLATKSIASSGVSGATLHSAMTGDSALIEAQLNSLEAAAGVSAWSSGGTYAAGAVVYSPTDFKNYRNKTGAVGTDPAGDTTNWQLTSAFAASEIQNTPANNIASTTVQAAINELDTEKAAIAGAAFTGPISATAMDSTPIGGTTPAAGTFTNLSATTGFDLGQTWQDVTASRAAAVTYTNTTGKPIVVSVLPANSGSTGSTGVTLTVNGVDIVCNIGLNGIGPGNLAYGAIAVVPPGGTYSVAIVSATITRWSELR